MTPGYGNDFLDTTSKAKSMEEIIDKLDFVKTINLLCKRQGQVNNKQQEWQNRNGLALRSCCVALGTMSSHL